MDIYSTPSLQKDEINATKLMRIRLDSRGGAIKRTILGYRDQYDAALKHGKSKFDQDMQEGANYRKLTNKCLPVTQNSPQTEKKKIETLASLKLKGKATIRSPANSSHKQSILQMNASGFKGREISLSSPLGSHIASPIPRNNVNVQDSSCEKTLESPPNKDET